MDRINQINLLTTKIEAYNMLIVLLDKTDRVELLKKVLRINDCLISERRFLIMELENGRAA